MSVKKLKIADFTLKTNVWTYTADSQNYRKRVQNGTIRVRGFVYLVTWNMYYTGERTFKKGEIARLSESFDGTLSDEKLMRVLSLDETTYNEMKMEVLIERMEKD